MILLALSLAIVINEPSFEKTRDDFAYGEMVSISATPSFGYKFTN